MVERDAVALLMNGLRVSIVNWQFQPGSNWFLVGVGYLIIGGFRCLPPSASKSLPSSCAVEGDINTRSMEEDRFTNVILSGLLIMICGALYVFYAAFSM